MLFPKIFASSLILAYGIIHSSCLYSMEEKKETSDNHETVELYQEWFNRLHKFSSNKETQSEYLNSWCEILQTMQYESKDIQLDTWLHMLQESVSKQNRKLTKKFCKSLQSVFQKHYKNQKEESEALVQIQTRALIHYKTFPLNCFKKLDQTCFKERQLKTRKPRRKKPQPILSQHETNYEDLNELLLPYLYNADPETILELLIQHSTNLDPVDQFALFETYIRRTEEENFGVAKTLYHYLEENIYNNFFKETHLEDRYKIKLSQFSRLFNKPSWLEQASFDDLRRIAQGRK